MKFYETVELFEIVEVELNWNRVKRDELERKLKGIEGEEASDSLLFQKKEKNESFFFFQKSEEESSNNKNSTKRSTFYYLTKTTTYCTDF